MSYRDLKSYEQATIIYDYTVEFCNRYVVPTYEPNTTNKSYRSNRTVDQMIQAARSSKQNIVEGSSNRTSEKSELKLLGVARASFQELLGDYEDFLRQRGLEQWDKNDPRAKEIRNLSYMSNKTYLTYKSYLENPEAAANIAICLIHQANFLLDNQIRSAEKNFIQKGGYTENLRRQRDEEKKKQIINAFRRKHFL